jgi:hypothetical protein
MKLTIEKHPDISRLRHCFQKIEALAYDWGMDVDDLLKDKPFKVSPFENTSNEQKEFASYRAKIFKDSSWDVIR